MTSETDQLAHDFEEVSKLLARYPQIHAVQTEGEPPAVYEIEYQVNGLIHEENGGIGQTARHVLRINLPFGYPHFPPAVKPLTPLFHPDIDPDAVRIASHWQQNPSLADLILHLGEMICATYYNSEDPFNQEAADWYSEHANEFPLDELRQGDADFAGGDLSLEDDNDLTQGLELENDDDLTGGLEIDIPEAEEHEEESDFGLSLEADVGTGEENIDERLEEIQYHIDRNEVVTAGKLLSSLSLSSPEAQKLEKIVSSALARRDKLLRELEELENEDQFADAYTIFKKVREIAPDTPALSDIGQRLQQSQAMLDAFSMPMPTGDEQVPAASDKGKKTGKKKKSPGKSPEKEKRKEKPAIERKSGRPPVELPVRTIFTALLLLAIGGGAVFLHNNAMKKMGELESRWIEIKYQHCATPDQFKEKRIRAEKLLVNLKSVLFPWLGQEKLEKEIRDVLDSPDFKKGENGAREYKGVPLPVPVIKKLEPVDQKIDQAARAAQGEKFAHALSLYQEALSLAEKSRPGALEPHAEQLNAELDKRIPVISEKIEQLQAQAEEEERVKESRLAEEAYLQSLDFFQEVKDRESNPSEMEDAHSTGELWKQCVTRLEHARRLLDEYPKINSSERQEKIKTLLAYSRLYQELDLARHAYEDGEFITAINEYERALRLLEENRSDLNTIYNDAVLKVGRTVVMLNVSLELRKAVEAENRNDLKNSVKHYKKILHRIRSSQVNKDATLNKLEKYIRSKIDEQSLEAAKSSNQEWWQRNYRKIFKKEFPSARPALLSKPRIHFIKVKNGRLLYTVRCSEKGVTFELNYQYDLASGEWSPYHGKL